MKNEAGVPAPSSLFFDGCSWGCIYYAGVYRGLWRRCGAEALATVRWGGASSGALMALGGALGKTPADVRALYDELAHVASLYGVFGKMSVYHEVVLARWLPDGGSEFRRLNGRLFVGLTRPVDRFELVSEWDSNEELRDTLHGSMHIPYYMTHLAKVKGGWALDGGFAFAGRRATIDARTVNVGADLRPCFDICPPQPLSFDECFAPTDVAGRTRLLKQGDASAAAWCRGDGRSTVAVARQPDRESIVLRFLSSSTGRRIICLFFWALRCMEQHGTHRLLALCCWLWWRRRKV